MSAGKAALCSVLVASRHRPKQLEECLESLAAQSVHPHEVLVAWQGNDHLTAETAEKLAGRLPFVLRVIHSPQVGIVPAENAALRHSKEEIVLLIDDDSRAPADWIKKHLAFYQDISIGAVGGPIDNYRLDGSLFLKRADEPVLKLAWTGKVFGNAHDQVSAWRRRPPVDVDHLIGSNMSFRREAVTEFEGRLKPYWQQFELDACLQIKARGYRIVFDFSNVVEHHPTTNTAYVPDREGDLRIKVYNPSFNHAFILSKHSAGITRWVRLCYMLAVGSVQNPGVAACMISMGRYGRPFREIGILVKTLRMFIAGWRDGRRR